MACLTYTFGDGSKDDVVLHGRVWVPKKNFKRDENQRWIALHKTENPEIIGPRIAGTILIEQDDMFLIHVHYGMHISMKEKLLT